MRERYSEGAYLKRSAIFRKRIEEGGHKSGERRNKVSAKAMGVQFPESLIFRDCNN